MKYIVTILAALGAVFGVFLSGKKAGKNEEELDQARDTITKAKEQAAVRKYALEFNAAMKDKSRKEQIENRKENAE